MTKQSLIAAILCCATSTLAQSPAHTSLLQQFQGPGEKIAKDAVWTSPRMFKVGVLDNGTNRDGYASYVCGEAASMGLKSITVQIIDVAKLKRTGKWIKLGEQRCQ